MLFWGFAHSADRLKVYEKLRNDLRPEVRAFWDAKTNDIESGVVHTGKFERYFQLFANRILPFIHGKRNIESLLAVKEEKAQAQIFEKKWNTWRWRSLFKLFFSQRVMGFLGRDPSFFAQVDAAVSQLILERAARHLRSTGAQQNAMLRYQLTGEFGAFLPHYLQPEHLKVIKNRLDRIVFYEGYIQDAATHYGRIDGMNLSDVFEYMDVDTCKAVTAQLVAAANQGCRLAYWNLLVPRQLSNYHEKCIHLQTLSKQLSAKDKGFFYNGFYVDECP